MQGDFNGFYLPVCSRFFFSRTTKASTFNYKNLVSSIRLIWRTHYSGFNYFQTFFQGGRTFLSACVTCAANERCVRVRAAENASAFAASVTFWRRAEAAWMQICNIKFHAKCISRKSGGGAATWNSSHLGFLSIMSASCEPRFLWPPENSGLISR